MSQPDFVLNGACGGIRRPALISLKNGLKSRFQPSRFFFNKKCVYCNKSPIKIITLMNKKQRKKLQDLCDQAEEIKQEVEMIRDDEQEKIDNLPESLQGSSKEDEYQQGIDALEEVISSLEEVIDNFSEVL